MRGGGEAGAGAMNAMAKACHSRAIKVSRIFLDGRDQLPAAPSPARRKIHPAVRESTNVGILTDV
jgi:hypothetical protein